MQQHMTKLALLRFFSNLRRRALIFPSDLIYYEGREFLSLQLREFEVIKKKIIETVFCVVENAVKCVNETTSLSKLICEKVNS